jgi:hypothetical protein
MGVFLAKVAREASTSEKAAGVSGEAVALRGRFEGRAAGNMGAIITPCSSEHITLAIKTFGRPRFNKKAAGLTSCGLVRIKERLPPGCRAT